MDIKFQFKWNICGLSIYRGFFELKLSLNSPPRHVCVHSCVYTQLYVPLIRNRAVAAAAGHVTKSDRFPGKSVNSAARAAVPQAS